ncbi:MAG: SGNH/GDSL hydrolase family protein [Isosphaeraceae bacterium]
MVLSPSYIRDFALTTAALALGFSPAGAVLRDDRLNLADVETRERGYYETLIDAGRSPGAPAEPHGEAPRDPFQYGELAFAVDDLREYALKPNLRTTHLGATWTTNALGMRDRAYAAVKPVGTVRIALVGDSIGSGWGVDDSQGFEELTEQTLDSRSKAAGGQGVEVLNFSVPGHAPGQRWEDFRRVGWSLSPDLLIYEATPADLSWDERRLRALLPRGLGWDAPQYRDALTSAGATPGGDAKSYARLLKPNRWQILENVYRTMVNECRAHGVPTVWILIPRVGRDVEDAERDKLIGLARRAGFAATVDLSDVFEGLDPNDLAIAPDDFHPNTKGHARLAGRLESALTAHPEWLRTGAETEVRSR